MNIPPNYLDTSLYSDVYNAINKHTSPSLYAYKGNLMVIGQRVLPETACLPFEKETLLSDTMTV